MPNFIECLLNGHEDLDAEALNLYAIADANAKETAKENGKKDYAADEIATELDMLITAQIGELGVNGDDLHALSKKNLEWYADVGNWSAQEAGHNMSKCAALQQVTDGVINELVLKAQQQQVGVLRSACETYIAHLKGVMRMEGGGEREQEELLISEPDYKSSNKKLNTAAAQLNVVNEMLKTLKTEQPPGEKIESFRSSYIDNKKIIEMNRDSAADKFLKVINTLLKIVTGKFSQISDLWKSKEERISGKMQDALQSPGPKKGG